MLKAILNVIFIILALVAGVAGFITNFLPIEGSNDMSRFGVEYYRFVHYWYIWTTIIVCMIGYGLTAKK